MATYRGALIFIFSVNNAFTFCLSKQVVCAGRSISIQIMASTTPKLVSNLTSYESSVSSWCSSHSIDSDKNLCIRGFPTPQSVRCLIEPFSAEDYKQAVLAYAHKARSLTQKNATDHKSEEIP